MSEGDKARWFLALRSSSRAFQRWIGYLGAHHICWRIADSAAIVLSTYLFQLKFLGTARNSRLDAYPARVRIRRFARSASCMADVVVTRRFSYNCMYLVLSRPVLSL